jgi:sigma-E factor negative regulatory protein RseA
MNELHRESLSALFDGKASEMEVRRILSSLDNESMAKWQRYQLIGDALRNKLSESRLNISVVDQVAADIANMPLETSTETTARPWLKPLLGFASAASIAFAAVLLVQQMPGSSPNSGFVASGNVSASQLPMNTANGLNTVSGTVKAEDLQRESALMNLQREQDMLRLQFYMQQHAQQASFNNGRGLMPMAKVPAETK